MTPPPLEVLQPFIAELRVRHREVSGGVDASLSLVLADTMLLHAIVRPRLEHFPRQIVVIGPTQTGKSTVVNTLLGQQVAVASPLAGFTRHPQGFTRQEITLALRASLDNLLPAFRFRTPGALNPDEPDAYTLQRVPIAQPLVAEPCIVWDTPDFDSVSSRAYRYAVPMMCSLADAIVLVVSREKYADQSVWELLRLIAPLGRPLLVCLNKSLRDVEATLRDAISRKFEQEEIAFKYLMSLPWLPEKDGESLTQHPDAGALRTSVAALLGPAPDGDRTVLSTALLHQHWDEWVAPLREEHATAARWEILVNEQIQEALALYEREYLRQPIYDETLQLAIARLLELLEIPGVATALARVRQTITWPARTLWSLARRSSRAAAPGAANVNQESQIIDELARHVLLTLQNAASENAISEYSRTWWQMLQHRLRLREPDLHKSLQTAIENHHKAFAPEIKAAAASLYDHLQAHPATLHSLRAARITVDAAAIALAIKTGGFGPTDLVIAPAMLAFTSLLTESAVGRYMNRLAEELRNKQRASVRTHVLEPLRDQLIVYAAGLNGRGLYAIPPDKLAAAERALEELN